jgi:hypothetical protein
VSRKLALALVLMSGLFWLGSTFAFNYPAKTQAVDNLTDSFRPVFSNAGISPRKASRQSTGSPRSSRPRPCPPWPLNCT